MKKITKAQLQTLIEQTIKEMDFSSFLKDIPSSRLDFQEGERIRVGPDSPINPGRTGKFLYIDPENADLAVCTDVTNKRGSVVLWKAPRDHLWRF